jgi:cob(I)alamin adenosyltransferase
MANRLSKIYTRTGDDGSTGLGDGTRVAKDSLRVEAYGTVDEANSAIGVVLATPGLPAAIVGCLTRVQHELFDLGAELCVPGYHVINGDHVLALETDLDALNEPLPSLKEFVLPAGPNGAAAAHLARTIIRRAERRVWSLAAAEPVADHVAHYLNRLSDLMFVVARVLARSGGGEEVLWKSRRTAG